MVSLSSNYQIDLQGPNNISAVLFDQRDCTWVTLRKPWTLSRLALVAASGSVATLTRSCSRISSLCCATTSRVFEACAYFREKSETRIPHKQNTVEQAQHAYCTYKNMTAEQHILQTKSSFPRSSFTRRPACPPGYARNRPLGKSFKRTRSNFDQRMSFTALDITQSPRTPTKTCELRCGVGRNLLGEGSQTEKSQQERYPYSLFCRHT